MTTGGAVEGAQLVTGLIAARARGDVEAVRLLSDGLRAARAGDDGAAEHDPVFAVAELTVTLLARVRNEPVEQCAKALGLAIEQGVAGRAGENGP
jgi:hypothetical protein